MLSTYVNVVINVCECVYARVCVWFAGVGVCMDGCMHVCVCVSGVICGTQCEVATNIKLTLPPVARGDFTSTACTTDVLMAAEVGADLASSSDKS